MEKATGRSTLTMTDMFDWKYRFPYALVSIVTGGVVCAVIVYILENYDAIRVAMQTDPTVA